MSKFRVKIIRETGESKKENDNYSKEVVKKMKDYMKDMYMGGNFICGRGKYNCSVGRLLQM